MLLSLISLAQPWLSYPPSTPSPPLLSLFPPHSEWWMTERGKANNRINIVSFEPLIWFSVENTGCSIYMLTHHANMTATVIEVECGKCAVSDQVSTSQDYRHLSTLLSLFLFSFSFSLFSLIIHVSQLFSSSVTQGKHCLFHYFQLNDNFHGVTVF